MSNNNFWSVFLLKFRHRLLTKIRGSGRQRNNRMVRGIRRKSENYFTGFTRQKETVNKSRNSARCHRRTEERLHASDQDESLTTMNCAFDDTCSQSNTSYAANMPRSPDANQKSRKLIDDSNVRSSSNEASECSSNSNSRRRTRARSDAEVESSSSSSSSSGSSSSGNSSNERSGSSRSVLSLRSRNRRNSVGFRVVGKQKSGKSSEYSARVDASHSDNQSTKNNSVESSTKSNFVDSKFRPTFNRTKNIENPAVQTEDEDEKDDTEELRSADDTFQVKRSRCSSKANLDLESVGLDSTTDRNPQPTGGRPRSTRNVVDAEDGYSCDRSLQTSATTHSAAAESCCKIDDSRSSRKRELVKIVMKKTEIKGRITARKLTKSPIINIYGEVVFDRCSVEDESKLPGKSDSSPKKLLQGPEFGRAEAEGEVELKVVNEKNSDAEEEKEEKGEERGEEEEEATEREIGETDGVFGNSAPVKTGRRNEVAEHRITIESPEEIIRINSENWDQQERLSESCYGRHSQEQRNSQRRRFANFDDDFDAEIDLLKNNLTVLCEDAIARVSSSTPKSALYSTKQSDRFSGFEAENLNRSVDGPKRRKFRRCELRPSSSEGDECLLCACSSSSGEFGETRKTTMQNGAWNAIAPPDQHSGKRCSLQSLNWDRQGQRHRLGRDTSKIEDHTSTTTHQMTDSLTDTAIFQPKDTVLCGPALALRNSSNFSSKETDLKSEVKISVDDDDDTKGDDVSLLHEEESVTVAIKDSTSYVSPSITLAKAAGTAKGSLNFSSPSGRASNDSPEPVNNRKSGSRNKDPKGNGEEKRLESTPSSMPPTRPKSKTFPRRDSQYFSKKSRNDNSSDAQRKSPGSYQRERCEKSRSNSRSKSNPTADDRSRDRRKSSRTDRQRIAEENETNGSRREKVPSTAKNCENGKRSDVNHQKRHETSSARNDTERRRSETTGNKRRSRPRSARDREEQHVSYERPQTNEHLEFGAGGGGDIRQHSSQIQTNFFNSSPYFYFPFAAPAAHRFIGPSFGYNPYLFEFDYHGFQHRHLPRPIPSTFPPGPRFHFQHWPRHQIPYPPNFPFVFPSQAAAAADDDDDAVAEPDDCQKISGECDAFSQDVWQNDFMPTESNAQTQEQERPTAATIDGEIRGALPSQTVCHEQL